MTAQQQAFRAYYSSLNDAELLKIAANRRSFLDVAQEALAVELHGRNLVSPQAPPSADNHAREPRPNLFNRMTRKARGLFSREP